MGVPLYVICYFNIVSLTLIFVTLITMCLGVFLLGFILPGTLCASCWLCPSPCSGRFQLLSLQTFSQVLSLSLLLLGLLMWMSVHLMLSERSLRLSSFLFILFSIFCSVAVISTILFSRSFICSSACYSAWLLLVYYSFSLFCGSCRSLVNFSYIFSMFASILFLDPGSSSLSLFWILFLEVAYLHFI